MQTYQRVVCLMLLLMLLWLPVFSGAAPGDVLVGQKAAVWRITSYVNGSFPTGIVADMLTTMAGMPASYAAIADIQEWTAWLRIHLALTFNKVFPQEVYNAIIYSVEYYQYNTPQIQALRKPPTCMLSVDTITCDEDPTGAERTPTLWRYVGNEFVEQDLTGLGITLTLVGADWIFSNVPSGAANTCVAYDDGESFPTLLFTTL